MKHAEYSGSRGFADQLIDSGQRRGYDVGQMAGGISKFFTWRETPFMMYIAISVIPGIRAQHVKLDLTYNHMTLFVGDTLVSSSVLIN
ncbi:hypothetical protein BdWA1_002963 [Babesia duncani]|uniref:Uncharacterized protein n=1 Tax=Babesia duncani TaxID=323732 RepID=A0AAD9PI55_9APIC|nr:hypothetical protein BdWA1_002963 [Babesia duncani]